MAYTEHFKRVDEVVDHLHTFVPQLPDPLMQSNYTGFTCVLAATVYELAVKQILCDFATKKHKVFGAFTTATFQRINGRIKTRELVSQHVKRFGDKYEKRLKRQLAKKEHDILRRDGVSIRSCYNNIVSWRHAFAHEGTMPTNATFDEASKSYKYGKVVLECLHDSMKR